MALPRGINGLPVLCKSIYSPWLYRIRFSGWGWVSQVSAGCPAHTCCLPDGPLRARGTGGTGGTVVPWRGLEGLRPRPWWHPALCIRAGARTRAVSLDARTQRARNGARPRRPQRRMPTKAFRLACVGPPTARRASVCDRWVGGSLSASSVSGNEQQLDAGLKGSPPSRQDATCFRSGSQTTLMEGQTGSPGEMMMVLAGLRGSAERH